jgi:co-chaperonin GroES (HSP10)
MNIKPLRDKIIVKPEQRFQSELLDLSNVEGAFTIGYVVAAGDEALRQGLKIGDKVHFGTIAATAKDEYLKFEGIKLGEDKCLKMSWMDVCFVEELEDAQA